MNNQEEQNLREALAKAGQLFAARGMAPGTSGNMSARLPSGGFLVTPTGGSLGDLNSEKISLLDQNGEYVSGAKPTKEAPMHLACYAARPEAGAIVHLHSPMATAFSCLAGLDRNDAVPAYTPYGLMRYGRVGLCPYARPGSVELAKKVAEIMAEHKAALMANHGLIVTGKNLEAAVANAEELEESCRIYFTLSGHKAVMISCEDQEELLKSKA